MILPIICATTIFLNTSGLDWNKHDTKIYKRAKHVCSTDKRYKDTNPCVKKFIKKEARVYNVICGAE